MEATRVYFREQQVLRATDLSAEQAYLLAGRRRHNIAMHGWGIVNGLEIIQQDSAFVLSPGLAVDGYGRELIVPVAQQVDLQSYQAAGELTLEVWLVYRVTPLVAGVGHNGAPVEPRRVLERAALRLIPVDAASAAAVDFRAPPGVPTADLTFPPYHDPVDDPARGWPIYLGLVSAAPGDKTNKNPYPAARPRATLVGESLSSVSQAQLAADPTATAIAYAPAVQVDLARELGGGSRRFAVRLVNGAGQQIERLALNSHAANVLRGHLHVQVEPAMRKLLAQIAQGKVMPKSNCRFGLLNLDRPKVEASADAATGAPAAAPSLYLTGALNTPQAATPWRIYRTDINNAPQADQNGQELRVELGGSADKVNPRGYRMAIGVSGGPGIFQPCLVVDAGCNVYVYGQLVVEGDIIQPPVPADPNDPRFAKQLTDEWLKGLEIGKDALGTLLVAIDAPGTVERGKQLDYTVHLKNASAGKMIKISATKQVRFGASFSSSVIKLNDDTLAPGAELSGTDKISKIQTKLPPGDTIIITVTASAIGPDELVVYATVSHTVQIV